MRNLLLAAMLASCCVAAAQNPKVEAKVVELSTEKGVVVERTLGSVFDTRNLLRVNISVTAPNAAGVMGDQSVAIANLTKAVQAAETMSTGATRLFNAPNDAANRIGQLAGVALQALSNFDVATKTRIAGEPDLPTDPPAPAGTYVRVARGLRKYAEEQLSAITAGIRARSGSGAGAKFNVTLTVIQSREMRQGRTYAKDLKDLLAVTEAEKQLAASLTPEQLAAKLKAWSEEAQALVKKYYDDVLKPKIDDLETTVGQGRAEIATIRQLIADMATITPANAGTVIPTLPGKLQTVITQLGLLRSEATAKVDELIALVNPLIDQMKAFIESRLNLGRIEEIARQVRNIVLGEGESKSFKIGTKTPANAPDIEVPLENGDKVQIVVTAKPVDNANADATPVLDQSSRGYKLGDNLLRTVTYNWFEQEDSKRTRNAPSINFLAKRFGRDLAGNSTRSIGLGVAWFPLGVDQQRSGSTNQQAFGVVVSLLDDWLAIGYARNLSSSKNFLFGGLMVPIRF